MLFEKSQVLISLNTKVFSSPRDMASVDLPIKVPTSATILGTKNYDNEYISQKEGKLIEPVL
jgi:hypothetical protein